jgi:hypothetical protein
MIQKGSIPFFRDGKIICSTKEALQEHFEQQVCSYCGCFGLVVDPPGRLRQPL